MKFKDKEEFAKAIMKAPLYNRKGEKVFFDLSMVNPFRTKIMNQTSNEPINDIWDDFDEEWYDKPFNTIKDKELVECWGNRETHVRVLKFYDAKNKCTYNYAGERDGNSFSNYRAIPRSEYPEWAIEAQKTLKD